jgi:NADH-ubiquinone oxidoreductase chain 6
MTYLFFLVEFLIKGLILLALQGLAIICGILVITTKNPVVSVFFLIGLFATVSLQLMSLGLIFLGLSYLIVYIGAVSILFLFILMLINVRTSELQSNTTNSLALSFITGVLFINPLLELFPFIYIYIIDFSKYISSLLNYIYYLFYKILKMSDSFKTLTSTYNSTDIGYTNTNTTWDGSLIYYNHITTIGNIIFTNYNIWLIISSFILLLSMVGAIVITIKAK